MPGNLCEHCVGYCCRHIALPIEKPTERSDFDDIRWYLLHGGVTVFVEDGEWFIHIETACRHLQADFRCGIYATRPQICRDYTTENCDYHSGDYGWEAHFTCAEHLDVYVEKFLKSETTKKSSQSKTSRNKQEGDNRKKAKVSRKVSGSLKIKKRRQADPDARYLAATRDRHGVALPVLGVRP